MKKNIRIILIILIVAFIGIQFVPVEKTNPPVTREVAWNSPQTKALADRACMDCHSNNTVWPWYASVAPISWRIAEHVNDGRRHLNFSTWDKPNEDLDEVKEQIEEGEMPLWDYAMMHPTAKLTEQEKNELIRGLSDTFAADPPVKRERRRRPPQGESEGE